jgi:hypothetical protein
MKITGKILAGFFTDNCSSRFWHPASLYLLLPWSRALSVLPTVTHDIHVFCDISTSLYVIPLCRAVTLRKLLLSHIPSLRRKPEST